MALGATFHWIKSALRLSLPPTACAGLAILSSLWFRGADLMAKQDPFQSPDDSARALAHRLMDSAPFAALAVLQPGTTVPSVTRIALTTDAAGRPLSLVSGLSHHTRALIENPACALLIGEPGDKGDPLTHPRLTLHANAHLVDRNDPIHVQLRTRFVEQRPKSKLYIDLPDFRFLKFKITDGLLNGGFGKAYVLSTDDLNRT